MNSKNFFILAIAIMMFIGISCSDNESSVLPEKPEEYPTVPIVTQKVNKFIIDCMKDFYVWENKINWTTYEQTYNKRSDPNELFEEIRYKDDHWGFLTDEIKVAEQELSGISTTYGYSLYLTTITGYGDQVFPVVQYVSPNSPAEKAGIKRGDLFIAMNGKKIDTLNYLDLYYSSSIKLELGHFETEDNMYVIKDDTVSVSMSAVEMYESPLLCDSIIIAGDKKIGYLCFNGFQIQAEQEMIDIFTDFKVNNVTDVVLDMRYNNGGYVHTARMLCSVLAPEVNVKAKEVFLFEQWNELLTAYNNYQGYEMEDRFVDTLSVNMNLDHIYILTSNNTASASESTIISLIPYMKVIQIGNTTFGKYYGCSLFSPEDYYDGYYPYFDNKRNKVKKTYYSDFNNWGIYVTFYYFTNKDKTYFTGGLSPSPENIATENRLLIYPFGDKRDPLFGRAYELITGETNTLRSAVLEDELQTTQLVAPKKAWEEKFIDTRFKENRKYDLE